MQTSQETSQEIQAQIYYKTRTSPRTSFYVASRWVTLSNFQLTAGNAIGFYSTNFKLSDLDDYTSYTSLFDQYKIKNIVIQFRLLTNPDAPLIENTTTANQNTVFPDFYCTVDHDNDNVPSSISQLQQYWKCKDGILRPNSWYTYSFRPSCNRLIYDGVTSAYSIGQDD